MGYRVEYGPQEKKQESKLWNSLKMQILTTVFLLFFVLGVRGAWPEGTEKLKEFLLPGQPSVTETAFQNLISDLKEGDSIPDAVSTFCREIVEHAQISD